MKIDKKGGILIPGRMSGAAARTGDSKKQKKQ